MKGKLLEATSLAVKGTHFISEENYAKLLSVLRRNGLICLKKKKSLLSNQCVPDTVLEPWDTRDQNKIPALREATA